MAAGDTLRGQCWGKEGGAGKVFPPLVPLSHFQEGENTGTAKAASPRRTRAAKKKTS